MEERGQGGPSAPERVGAFWRTLHGDMNDSLCWSEVLHDWHKSNIEPKIKWAKQSVTSILDRNITASPRLRGRDFVQSTS
jgi:hypothetical protein